MGFENVDRGMPGIGLGDRSVHACWSAIHRWYSCDIYCIDPHWELLALKKQDAQTGRDRDRLRKLRLVEHNYQSLGRSQLYGTRGTTQRSLGLPNRAGRWERRMPAHGGC